MTADGLSEEREEWNCMGKYGRFLIYSTCTVPPKARLHMGNSVKYCTYSIPCITALSALCIRGVGRAPATRSLAMSHFVKSSLKSHISCVAKTRRSLIR